MENRQPVMSPERNLLSYSDDHLMGRIAIAESMLDEISRNEKAGETDKTVNRSELVAEHKVVSEEIELLAAEADMRGLLYEFNNKMEVA